MKLSIGTEQFGLDYGVTNLEKKYNNLSVDKHIIEIGKACQLIWKNHAEANNLDITISGLPKLSSFSLNSHLATQYTTRFTTEMLQRGYLAWRQFKPSYAS